MLRSALDGLYKRCACSRAKWTKCEHPWHFDFFRKSCACLPRAKCPHGAKNRIRYSLHKLAGKPPDYVMKKDEAKLLRDEYRSQIRSGEFIDPKSPPPIVSPNTKPTFGDIVDRYIKSYVDVPARRESSRKAMKWHLAQLRRAEIPGVQGTVVRLEDKHFNEITKLDVEAIRDARRAEAARVIEARAKSTTEIDAAAIDDKALTIGVKLNEVGTNRLFARLRHVFTWAIENGVVTETPFKRHGVTVIRFDGKAENGRSRRLMPGEEDGLLLHSGAHLHAVVVAGLETGCRQGELLQLQWSDVECINHTKTDGTIERVPVYLLLTADKTKTSESRRVPVTARLRAVLEMRRLDPKGREFPSEAFVFGNRCGEQIKSIKKAWEVAVLKSHGYDLRWIKGKRNHLAAESRAAYRHINLHFHDLRREFASRLRETPGVSDHQVRDWLGHANITTTSRYLATTPITLQAALRKFEEHREPTKKNEASQGTIATPLPHEATEAALNGSGVRAS